MPRLVRSAFHAPAVRLLTTFCVVAFAAAILTTLAAAETNADSRITAVTVYADRAMVERTAGMLLEPGVHRVLFSGLPSAIDERSIRVGGRARFPVTILGSETKKILHKEAADERIRSLEEKIAKLEAEKNEALARLGVIESQRTFVESIRSSSTELLSKDLALGKIDAASWRAALDFVGSSLEDLTGRRLSLEAEVKELDAGINLLSRELQLMRRTRPDQSFDVVAEIEAGSPGGEVELTISYLVRGASWEPSYDARLLLDQGAVEMTTYGVVAQKTGEDWVGVNLALSTAQPATGAAPPELSAWYLEPFRPELLAREVRMRESKSGAVLESDKLGADLQRAEEAEAPAVAFSLGVIEAALASHVDKAGVTATYNIVAREDVPADGTPIKTVIGKMSLKPTLKHATTPSLAQKVYLSSDIENDSDYSLLPGKVDVFVGPDMVGTHRLGSTVVPGEIFHLSFGPDPQVKVKHELVKKVTSKPGKRMKVFQSFKVTLTNHKPDSVEVRLKDRIPVSRSKDIKVDIKRLDPEPESVSPAGIAEWKIYLAPGEEAPVLIEYEISHPGGVVVRGL